MKTVSRRQFAKQTAITLAAAAAAPRLVHSAQIDKKIIGMQIGSISFVDEGTDKVLDILQERGAFHTEYAHATLRGNLGVA